MRIEEHVQVCKKETEEGRVTLSLHTIAELLRKQGVSIPEEVTTMRAYIVRPSGYEEETLHISARTPLIFEWTHTNTQKQE